MYSIYINKRLWDTQTEAKSSLTGRKLKKLICCTGSISRTGHRDRSSRGHGGWLCWFLKVTALALVPGVHHVVSAVRQSRRHCQHSPGRPPTSDSAMLRVLPPSVITRLCCFAGQQAWWFVLVYDGNYLHVIFCCLDSLVLWKKEFPGSPVVRTWHFHCFGQGSVPGWETKTPQAM